jgi:hypothetical protein
LRLTRERIGQGDTELLQEAAELAGRQTLFERLKCEADFLR